jgi:hypothetical protein
MEGRVVWVRDSFHWEKILLFKKIILGIHQYACFFPHRRLFSIKKKQPATEKKMQYALVALILGAGSMHARAQAPPHIIFILAGLLELL